LPELIFPKPMAADQSAGNTPSPVGISRMILTWLTLGMLAALPHGLQAQVTDTNILAELEQIISESYGPDQHLINGAEYFNLHIRSEGHKFLDEDKYYKGSVVIDKKIYKDVFLKYDIYNQQVLLLIEHPSGGNKQIILNNLRINEFEINDRIFHKFTFPGTTTLFYQVIGNNKMACFYHFRKQEIPRAIDQYNLSEFTNVQRKSYLHWQSELHAFKGTRSFIRIFPDHQPQIKSYIRQYKLNIRNLNDTEMQRLISYCNSLTKAPLED